MSLTSAQRDIISSTVPLLADHGLTITKTFYDKLLTENPELRNVFSHAAQVTSHQANALASSLYAYASNINDLTPILPVVERINHKHASLNILPKQYDLVGKGLLEAIRTVLGSDVFTDEVRDAWAAAYGQLADLMIKREEEIISEHESKEGGWRGWRQMKLVRKVPESSEVTSFYWAPTDGKPLPPFKPGQYISVRLDVPGLGWKQVRQYSLSDAPPPRSGTATPDGHANGTASANSNGTLHAHSLSNTFRISVKREAGIDLSHPDAERHPGYISNLLHDTVEVNSLIEMSHPAGEFFLDLDHEATSPIVLISAGVGLTPLMSMLQTLLQTGTNRHISWIHAAKTDRVDPFNNDIKQITQQHDNVRSKIFHSSPTSEEVEGRDYDVRGRLHLDSFSEAEKKDMLFIDDHMTQYFVCGPNAFMAAVSKDLKAMNVDANKVHMEVFSVGGYELA